ncbi:MAG TPA: hypothetical protein VG755_12345 [Nannocystaceae bacterium]|nr:hypothetical protein [Nannocystaceae bacterium]
MGTRTWVWACALMGACAPVGERCEECGESSAGATASASDAGSEAGSEAGAPADTESSAADESSGVPGESDAAESSGIIDTSTSAGTGPSCRELDEPCATDDECCIHPDGALVCVAGDEGASCQRSCDSDDDCASGCCVPLHGGGGACVAAEACTHDCSPLDAACEDDDECCDGTSCVEQRCALACSDHDQCPSGSCGDSTSCEAAKGCEDGHHFCSGGTTMFECDHDAWYALDCTAACIEAGWNGTSGCAYTDIYDDAACLCTDEVQQ